MTKLYFLKGPLRGRSFDLKNGICYVGRSRNNDIPIRDRTLSRAHLKIRRIGNKYLITDLKSRNGTLVNNQYIDPLVEVEVKEGTPIAIGRTVICIGEACMEHRDNAGQKNLELLSKVSGILRENLSIKETLERTLDRILALLKRLERGAFILTDPDTEKITQIVTRSNMPGEHTRAVYCHDAVSRVIKYRKPVVVSDADTEEDGELANALKRLGVKSLICVPLISRSQIRGVLYVDTLERAYGFQGEDLSLLVEVCRWIVPAIQTAQLISELSMMAEALSSEDS